MKKPYTPDDQRQMLELWHSIFVRNEDHEESMRKTVRTIQQFYSLEKRYSTFMRELNPKDWRAKLGATELFLLMHYFNDITPLEDWADRLGYKLVRAEDEAVTPIERKALLKLVESISCKKCPAASSCPLQYNDVSTYNAGDCVAEILRVV